MDRNSSYVSCIKINGKPIIPPLMTPKRREEMRHYRQLAVAVEAQLQGWARKDCSDKRNSVDSGVTMLSSTEHSSSDHHLCTNRRTGSGSPGEMESRLIILEDIAPLSSAVVKKSVPCNELEQRILKSVTDVDLSGSANIIGNSQHDIVQSNLVLDMGPTVQHLLQNNSSKMENGSQHITVDASGTSDDISKPVKLCEGVSDVCKGSRSEPCGNEDSLRFNTWGSDSRGVMNKHSFSRHSLRNKDLSVQNDKLKSVLVKVDTKVPDKCGLENMVQSSKFTLTGNILDTGYKSWETVHNSNNNSEGSKVLQPHQESMSGADGKQQGLEQHVTDSDINGNLVHNTHCHVDSVLTPIIQKVELKSTSLICAFDDHGQKYVSDDNVSDSRSESVNYKAFMSQNEINSKIPLIHPQQEVNNALFLHSQNAEKPDVPEQHIPCLDKEAYRSDEISKPVKFCEGVTDTCNGLQSELCGNEDSLRFNTSESDSKSVMNKHSFSRHSSAESTGLSGLADVSSSSLHLLPNENLEDSVSSVAMTSSTDLNHYMNTTGSSGSGSPGQDVAMFHNCKCSRQDVLHDTSDVVVLQTALLSKTSASGQDVQLASSNESNLISDQSSLTSGIDAQCIQNVDVKLGTFSNKDSVCMAEKLVVQDDRLNDQKMSCAEAYHESADCAKYTTKSFNKACKDVNCDIADQVKCLTVPNVKLKRSKAVDGCDNPVNKCVHDSDNTENSEKKMDELDITKLEATPPRLMRQNSYTLDSPSPLLVAHMKTQKRKSSMHDMTESAYISTKPCRKSWDLTKAKSNWESNRKKGKSLFAVRDEKGKSGKNSSLPPSNTSSPIKLQTPSASLDCLPLAVSIEPVKKIPPPSTPRKNKSISKDRVSSSATKVASTSGMSQKKSPRKNLRKDSAMENISVASQGNVKRTSETESVPLSPQRNVQALILHMQSEHSQQMANLLAKQRKEQEELRETFLRQQNELVFEIREIYSTAFCSPGCQEILAQLMPSCDYLANHGNVSCNSSISLLPSGVSSKSLSLGNAADTLELSTHDSRGKCILSDTSLERFQASISSTAEKEQNASGSSLNQNSLPDETQGSNDVTACLQESGCENVSAEEVLQNSLQNYSSLRLSVCDNTETHLLEHSSHPSISGSTSTQVSVLQQPGILQKHNSDSGEEDTKSRMDTCNNNCAVLPLSPTSPQAFSNVLAAETASLPGIVDNSLQRREVYFPPSSVPDDSPVCMCNSAWTKDRHSDGIQDHSTCIRQLFPAQEAGALCRIPPLCGSEREKIAATRITAAARGFLTRRLFRTARVQDLILTIRDTLLCAVQLNQDCWPNVTPEDVAFHHRLIQQVTASCYAIHEIFFSLPVSEQMAIIAADRKRIRNQTPRLPLPRPLSSATRIAIERKTLQRQTGHVPKKRPVSADCNFRKIKSAGIGRRSHSVYEVGRSCFLRQQQEAQLQSMTKKRSVNMNSGRKPWR